MRNKLLYSGIIAGIIFCISWICFAGEKEELQLKEALYNEMLQNAQSMIQHAQLKAYYANTELKAVQSRLQILEKQEEEKRKETIDNEINKLKEEKKPEIKTSNSKTIEDAIHYTPEQMAEMEKINQSKKKEEIKK